MEEQMKTIMQRLEDLEVYSLLRAKDVLTLEDAALLLGKKKETVRKLMNKHVIPFYKPTRNDIYFKRSELEAYMLQNRVRTDVEVELEAARIYRTLKKKKKCCSIT